MEKLRNGLDWKLSQNYKKINDLYVTFWLVRPVYFTNFN